LGIGTTIAPATGATAPSSEIAIVMPDASSARRFISPPIDSDYLAERSHYDWPSAAGRATGEIKIPNFSHEVKLGLQRDRGLGQTLSGLRD
jgi:hypothetical protein